MHVSIRASFEVAAPAELAFAVANRIENWPEMLAGCHAVEVLERQGWMTHLRLRARDGREWESRHFACPEALAAYTEHLAPTPPVASLQFVRTYRARGAKRTEIVEELQCELPASSEDGALRAAAEASAHRSGTQPRIARYIERLAQGDAQ